MKIQKKQDDLKIVHLEVKTILRSTVFVFTKTKWKMGKLEEGANEV